MVYDDAIHADAERVADDLGQRRGRPLAVRREPGVDRHRPARLDADGGALPGTGAADLDVRRQPDADQPAFGAGRGLLGAQVGVP